MEVEAPHFVFEAAFLGLLLGDAHRRDLRLAIVAARHAFDVQLDRLHARDGFGRHNALRRSDVRQHQLRVHVADGVNVGHVRAIVIVHHDRAALGLHARCFQPDTFGVRRKPDRDQRFIGLKGLAARFDFHTVARLRQRFDLAYSSAG